jgi:hypothetical protein
MTFFVWQDGVELGDVELPPWAAGSPDEFVRVHREVSISQLYLVFLTYNVYMDDATGVLCKCGFDPNPYGIALQKGYSNSHLIRSNPAGPSPACPGLPPLAMSLTGHTVRRSPEVLRTFVVSMSMR